MRPNGAMGATERLSVLFLEDNPGDVHLVQSLFRRRERPAFDIVHASTLEQGRLSIRQHRPDAVLLDLNLPDCRGIDTLQQLRAVDDGLPIVVLTGFGDEETALRAVEEGAQDYLVKDAIDDEVLARVVQYAITRGRLYQQHRATQRLPQSEKLELVGRLTAAVVHDFNNLLTVFTGELDLLQAALAQGMDTHRSIEALVVASHHATMLTQQLVEFCRGGSRDACLVDLNEVVGSMAGLLQRLLGSNIELTVTLAPEALLVRAERGRVEQILMNLVINARDAISHAGQIWISTQRVAAAAAEFEAGAPLTRADYGLLAIRDSGSGMYPETREHLFEPFFTTKAQGTGLGLATVAGIVREFGGEIAVDSEPGRGAQFRVYLPASASPPLSADRETRPSA